MAEVAGLVISGVGMAALFDSCMNAFNYVDSGSKYGREYNKIALKISLNQLRLTRWRTDVRFEEDETSSQHPGALVASPAESERVRELLGHIEDDFEEAERRAKKYILKEVPEVGNLERTDTNIAALTRRVQALAKGRQRAASMRQKASWALHDKEKFERLVEDQTKSITALIELFPAMEIKQKALADSEATTLAASQGEISPAESLDLLQQTAQDVDPVLQQAAVNVAREKGIGHFFGGTITSTGDARMVEGDHFDKEYRGPVKAGGDSYMSSVTLSGKARHLRGTNYGGKHIFDD